MSRQSSFFLGLICGAGGLLLLMNFYIVRSKETFHFVPKVAAKLELPYYDIRNFTVEDWQRRPSLAAAIVTSKNQNLMQHSGVDAVRSKVEGLMRDWSGTQ